MLARRARRAGEGGRGRLSAARPPTHRGGGPACRLLGGGQLSPPGFLRTVGRLDPDDRAGAAEALGRLAEGAARGAARLGAGAGLAEGLEAEGAGLDEAWGRAGVGAGRATGLRDGADAPGRTALPVGALRIPELTDGAVRPELGRADGVARPEDEVDGVGLAVGVLDVGARTDGEGRGAASEGRPPTAGPDPRAVAGALVDGVARGVVGDALPVGRRPTLGVLRGVTRSEGRRGAVAAGTDRGVAVREPTPALPRGSADVAGPTPEGRRFAVAVATPLGDSL